MEKLMQVMSSEHGDQPYKFGEGDAKATAEAQAVFESLMRQGGAAFNVGAQGQTLGRVKKFEELGERSILVPKFEGG